MKATGFVAALAFILSAFMAGCGGSGSGSADSASPPSTLQYLFVQSADSGTLVQSADDADVYILTLNGVRPTTTYFSDRPYRLSGYITTFDFTASWNDTSDDSFLTDPPNAALQIDGAPADADAVILELVDVLYEQATGTLKYRARVVHLAKDSVELFHARSDPAASMPASFAAASLFIDSWYSKAWHKVKKAADDASADVKKDLDDAAAKLKKAVADFETGLQDTQSALDGLAKVPTGMLEMSDEAFRRLISVVLPSGLNACLKVVPGPLPFDIAVLPSSLAHVNWMDQLSATIANRELRMLAMPGTHDSGTFPISGISPLPTELSNGNEWVGALLLAANALRVLLPESYLITGPLANWSRAQRHTISAQLAAGVRYFDLRIIPEEATGVMFATHGFAGAPLADIVAEMSEFMRLYPREILILDFQHLFARNGQDHGMTALDAEALVAQLTVAFGPKLVPHVGGTSPKDMKVSDLWNTGRQVVVVFETAPYKRMNIVAQQAVWPEGEVLDRRWPQSTSWDGSGGTRAYLDGVITDTAIVASSSVDVLQAQMTPTLDLMKKRALLTLTVGEIKAQLDCLKGASSIAADIVSAVTLHLDRLIKIDVTQSLQAEAAYSNPQLQLWVEAHRPRHIVIADFMADYPELIRAIVDSNR